MAPSSVRLLPHGGWRYLQLAPVPRDRAPRYVDVLLLKQVHYLPVVERFLGVLFRDRFLNEVPYGYGRQGVAVHARYAPGEEELQLVYAHRRVHIFVGRDPAYRRLMHPDVVRYVLQYHRLHPL